MALEDKIRARSPWIMHFDTGSCNGCDLEVWALLTRATTWRGSGHQRANPKQADILLITGRDQAMRGPPEEPLRADAGAKLVIACGDCASTGAPFHNCYNVDGGVDKVIPVDLYVPGAPAAPRR
jgi:ech hydrogenase subunit C